MAVAGLVRARKHQFGRQDTFGTKVAATRAYGFTGVPSVDLEWTDSEADTGSIVTTIAPERGPGTFGASLEANQLRGLENVDAKADQLNYYYYYTGQPDYLEQDLARMRAVTAADVQRVARTYLRGPRVTLSVVPQGRRELAATRQGATP